MPRTQVKGPLKRIIGYVGMPMDGAPYLMTSELLECGHAQRERQDMFGATNFVSKRRCRGCHTGSPVLPELAALVAAWDGQSEIRESDPLKTGFRLIN